MSGPAQWRGERRKGQSAVVVIGVSAGAVACIGAVGIGATAGVVGAKG